jgi:hypothetical protein
MDVSLSALKEAISRFNANFNEYRVESLAWSEQLHALKDKIQMRLV